MHAHGRDAIQRGALIPYKGRALDSIPQQVADFVRSFGAHEKTAECGHSAERDTSLFNSLSGFALSDYLVFIEFS